MYWYRLQIKWEIKKKCRPIGSQLPRNEQLCNGCIAIMLESQWRNRGTVFPVRALPRCYKRDSQSQYVLVSSPLCGRLTRYCFLFKYLGLKFVVLSPGLSAARRIRSIHLIGSRTRDLPACGIVPEPPGHSEMFALVSLCSAGVRVHSLPSCPRSLRLVFTSETLMLWDSLCKQPGSRGD
jgi:hypothetical protein